MHKNHCNGKEFVIFFAAFATKTDYTGRNMVNGFRLRGWVSADTVRDELARLESHSALTTNTTFLDKFRELRRHRTLKPFILAITLNFLLEFSGAMVWRAYIIQVLKAYGMPWDANFITTILSSVSIAGSCCVMLTVKTFGKRRLYLSSTIVVVFCAIGLSESFENYYYV